VPELTMQRARRLTLSKLRLQAGAAPSARQRGVASLIVVMVLFFVLSLVAAYTSRNLIFEQRTSANQYRSTQAAEAAEAGLEWALALLNSGRVDESCLPTADLAATSFRDRYLAIDGGTGNVTRRTWINGAAVTELWPTCVRDGEAWRCSCPAAAAPSLDAPTGAGVFPAFRIRFIDATPLQRGVIRIESTGCTRLDDACLVFPARAAAGDAGTTVSSLIALQSGLAVPPVAALTARTTIDVSGAGIRAINQDPTTGIAARAGGSTVNGVLATGAPGTPDDLSLVRDDDALQAPLDANRLFAAVFGMWPTTYQAQPAAVVLACPIGGCAAATVRNAATANPGRVLWAQGDVVFDSAGDIGSVAAPVALVATGNITFTEPTVTVFGLLYSRTLDWATAGGGTVRGAAVAEGAVSGSATTTFVYDPALLNTLNLQTGSFVRVPGSWRDFP
jgi:Tfp pilus assembly protein PilX